MLVRKGLVTFLILSVFLLTACSAPATQPEPQPIPPPPQEPPPPKPVEPSPEPAPPPAHVEETPPPPAEEPVDEFTVWWEEFKQPFASETSNYPAFYRGAYCSRLDELRYHLLNSSTLREAGFDSIMLGVDIIFDPATGEARSLGDDVFLFYLQALKREGFRIILIPNPMHPNLDMGLGYEWEEYDPEAGYHRSYELINRLNKEVIRWAAIAEEYRVDAFAPTNEPYKLVRDYQDASRWLQEILPSIKEVYHGPVWAVDTMHDTGMGQSIPYPYDYTGYDRILCGPPAGRQDVNDWEEMLKTYIRKGDEYVANYDLEGFGLYECGAYTGGVWYEDGLEAYDQILSRERAGQIAEAMVRQAEGIVSACFPRVSTGWIDIGTPSFNVVSAWYRGLGESIVPLESAGWTYEGLIEIEQKLGGEDYYNIFQIFEITDTVRQ